jgi:hypothetical protein
MFMLFTKTEQGLKKKFREVAEATQTIGVCSGGLVDFLFEKVVYKLSLQVSGCGFIGNNIPSMVSDRKKQNSTGIHAIPDKIFVLHSSGVDQLDSFVSFTVEAIYMIDDTINQTLNHYKYNK